MKVSLMLTNILFLIILLCAYLTGLAQQQEDGTIQPMVQIQKEDYATVRKHFKTTLIKKEGSPQASQASDSADVPPADATQILFTSGSLTLKAWMNKPSGNSNKKYPVIVFLHGGFAFGKGDWDMTKPFRDAGFIVIAPILRGENGQPGIFTMFYDEVDDAIAAALFAKGLPYVDNDRMFLAGHSVGGTITLLTAMLNNTNFKKAASFSGSPDQIIFCKYGIDRNTIPFDTNINKEFIVRSPLAYANSFKIPVRIFYGFREPHFRLSSQQTAMFAKKKKLDVEAVEVEGGHESAVAGEMKLAIAFFNQDK